MIDVWRQSVKRLDRTFEIEIIGNVQIGNIPKENWELFVTAIAEKLTIHYSITNLPYIVMFQEKNRFVK